MRWRSAVVTATILASGFLTALTSTGSEIARAEAPLTCPDGASCDTVVFVDGEARFHWWDELSALPEVSVSIFGNPGDVPLLGDWDCNGESTPGMYRPSNGFAYLRNSNTTGIADVEYFYGDPADIPLAGDFNGDGCDTLAIYRLSEGKVYIKNSLGTGIADYSFYFGDPGDTPFVGDFDGDGIDSIGLHRESSGFVYFRNSNTTGIADNSFYYGDPGDKLIAGDWDGDGDDTVAVYRSTEPKLYVKNSNEAGVADAELAISRSFETVLVSRSQTTTTTTTTPTTTVPPTSSSCSGVGISTTDDWQAKIDAHPAGTVFCVAGGVHSGANVADLSPKDGMQFIGEVDAGQVGWMRSAQSATSYGKPLTIIDGVWDGVVSCPRTVGICDPETGFGDDAFMQTNDSSNPASGVVLRNLEIRNFETWQGGAVGGHYNTNWLMENLYVHDNIHGVKIGTSSRLSWSLISDNYWFGVTSNSTRDGILEDSELRNNHRNEDWGHTNWGASATKFVKTTNFIIRRNYSHHNLGPGLWTDIDNEGTLYEDNLVEDNARSGIQHEISYSATIRNNTVRRNGGAANIYISNSAGTSDQPIRVYGNIVEDHPQWEIMIKDNGTRTPRPDHISIYDNTVKHSNTIGKVAGVYGEAGGPDLTKNFKWWANDYTVKVALLDKPFEWGASDKDWAGWKALADSTSHLHDNTPGASFTPIP